MCSRAFLLITIDLGKINGGRYLAMENYEDITHSNIAPQWHVSVGSCYLVNLKDDARLCQVDTRCADSVSQAQKLKRKARNMMSLHDRQIKKDQRWTLSRYGELWEF